MQTTPQHFAAKRKAPTTLGALLLANVSTNTIKKAAAPRLNSPRAPIKTPSAPARTPAEQSAVTMTYRRTPAQVEPHVARHLEQHIETRNAHDRLLASVKQALNPQTDASTAPRSI